MRFFSSLLLLAGLIPLSTVQAQEAPRAPTRAPQLILKDQFGQAADLAMTKGDVVILVYGDRNSVDANRTLGTYLHCYFHPGAKGRTVAEGRKIPVKPIPNWPAGVKMPDVRVVPVACAGKVPELIAKIIRGQIRKKSPDVPVYLDFENKMKRFFGVAAKISNVVVISPTGHIHYRASAKYNREQVSYLVKLVEQLRHEAKGDRASRR